MKEEIENFIYKHSAPNGCVALTRMERDELFDMIEQFQTSCLEKGLAEGRKETKAEWHDCFLSCSSPYCAAHFPAVEMQGELENMSKREPEAGK